MVCILIFYTRFDQGNSGINVMFSADGSACFPEMMRRYSFIRFHNNICEQAAVSIHTQRMQHSAKKPLEPKINGNHLC